MSEKLPKTKLLDIGFTTVSEKNILEYVITFIEKEKGKLFITTPNPEMMVFANGHKGFTSILNNSDISLPDGVGLLVASTVLGKGIKKRITGVDFMKNLCKNVANRPITVGFLGGKGDVALKTAECLRQAFPKLQILLAEAGNPDENTATMIKKIKGLDILFVGYGFPKQEKWIYEHLAQLPVRVAMTVGGSFDIVSGSLPRAPRFLQSLGLEWFWRLMLQPWRITRQIALPIFIWLVIKERFLNSSK